MQNQLDLKTLVAAINSERQARGWSWRQVANDAEVSPSTLTRMQQGKLPDVNTFATLIKWLNQPADNFLALSRGQPSSPPHPLTVASTLLRSKREVSPEALNALDELVRAAYAFSKKMGKDLK